MDTQASIQLEETTSIVCVTTSMYKRHPGKVCQCINDDEVILLYIEAFLISKSISPAEFALVKKSTPGLFFRCRSTLAHLFMVVPSCPSRLGSLWGCVGLTVPALPSSAGLPFPTPPIYLVGSYSSCLSPSV